MVSLTNLTKLVVVDHNRFGNKIKIPLDKFTALTKLQHFAYGRVNIAPYIQDLQNLTKLAIHTDGQLNLTDLDALTQLTRLEEFSFTTLFKLEGKINIISKFGNPTTLKRLTVIDRNGSVYFDEESAAKMSNVSKVSIECRNTLFPFSKLPNLESLSISSDQFDDFSTCTKLTFLTFEARGVAPTSALNHGLQQLTALTNIRILSIYSLFREDQFSFLSSLPNLEKFVVSGRMTGRCSGRLFEWVESSRLTMISFYTLTKLDYISHLTSLEHIRTESTISLHPNCSIILPNVTRLESHNIESVSAFPNLRQLTVAYDIYEDQMMKFGKASKLVLLTRLESLSLPKIGPQTLNLIAMHTQLTQLQLSLNCNEEYDLELFDHLTNLKVLALTSNFNDKEKSYDVLWHSISKMINLEELSLAYLDHGNVAVLEQLKKLKKLLIRGRCTRKFEEYRLSNLTNLQVLHFISDLSLYDPTDDDCPLNLPYLYDWIVYRI